LIISPGPCTPAEAGVSVDVVRALGATTPILGVCLGHQVIGAAYGGTIVRARHPMHGKTSAIAHDGTGIFKALPHRFQATRYHSLVVDRPSLPPVLVVQATSEDGAIMALRHRAHPVHGVQFHPESILTEEGHRLIANFLRHPA
jgi:anthranilate synthase component 2